MDRPKLLGGGEVTSAWDEEYDLICLGSGVGGCAAAIAGAEAGLRVALIEKSPRVGGTTAWSYGIVWAGNAGGPAADDSEAETSAYLNFLGGGRNDPTVTASFVKHAPQALQFYKRAAHIPLYMVETLPDHYYPVGAGSKRMGRNYQVQPFRATTLGEWQQRLEFTPYGHGRATFEEIAAWGGRAGYRNWDQAVLAQRQVEDVRTFGAGLAGHFFKSVIDHGVHVTVDTPADRLLMEDGQVAGVVMRMATGERRMKAAKGVVIATGQYDANPRLMGLFDEFNSWPPVAAPRNQGDGFVMAAEHGAAFTVMHWNLSVKLGYHVKGEEVDGQPLTRGAGSREVAYPHSMLVNRTGRRFCDESAFGDVATKIRHFDAFSHELVNMPCYFIFDRQYLAKYGLPPLPPSAEIPEWIPHAQTIPDLARILGVDEGGLAATAERFNHFAASGDDEDFRRGHMPWSRQAAGDSSQINPNLGPISEPPFFGLEMLPINGNSVGLQTDANGQVLHLRGHAIPGLYACGEVAAWLHVGIGYQAGLSLAGGMTFGWLAAQHAAGRSLA